MPEGDPAPAALVAALGGRPVMIVGDVMLDRYWWGTVSRLSPEAPVPVVHRLRTTTAPGGAANVAANVRSLGGTPILVGLTGADEAGRELGERLEALGVATKHLLLDPERPTTTKTRVVAVSQHVVRVDDEDRSPVAPALAAALTERVMSLLGSAPVVVISDYAKGLLTREVLRRVIAEARLRGCRVVVDPKGTDYSRYAGATVICPNRGEAFTATGVGPEDGGAVARAGAMLLAEVAVDAVLVTLGEAGMLLLERGRPPVTIPALARTVYDVTGAGDTVIAALGLALAAGLALATAVALANVAAGLAVEQMGTAAVTATQLLRALEETGERPSPAGG